jgi:hypothetical protein
MTDTGTMAIQVSPVVPTEDEMNKVQEILKRALDAVVSMSQLKTEVDALRQSVASMQADSDKLRTQNAGLDEALYQSRQARNDLTAKLQDAEHSLVAITQERDTASGRYTSVVTENDNLQSKLHHAEQTSDDWELKAMDLEDKLKASEAKLAAIREGYDAIFGKAPEAVQAAPEPEPAPASAPASEPVLNPVSDWTTGSPTSEPAPSPAPPARTYHGTGWAPGHIWDNQKKEYYTEVAA